jgi:hypothetical protein
MAELGPAAVPFSLSPAEELRPVLHREMDKLLDKEGLIVTQVL